METFLRTAGIYLFLLVLFRLSGKRTLSELSTFNFVLLLIISEATQNALIGEDYSVTTGMAVILTLVLLDHGKVLEERLKGSQMTQDEILQAARQNCGLERLDQIKYAVLETSGGISIIPMTPDLDELLDRRIEAALARRAKEAPPGPG